jgi:hypothetical protein
MEHPTIRFIGHPLYPPFRQIVRPPQTLAVQKLLLDIVGKLRRGAVMYWSNQPPNAIVDSTTVVVQPDNLTKYIAISIRSISATSDWMLSNFIVASTE